MEFTHTLRYPAPLEQVLKVLTNPDFMYYRFLNGGAKATVNVSEPDPSGARTLVTTATVPADKLPSGLRRLLPPQLDVTISETFTPHDGGLCTVLTNVSLETLPITFTATSTLTDASTETQRDVTGDLSIRIPFFGSKLETMAMDYVDKAAQAEVESVTEWLTS